MTTLARNAKRVKRRKQAIRNAHSAKAGCTSPIRAKALADHARPVGGAMRLVLSATPHAKLVEEASTRQLKERQTKRAVSNAPRARQAIILAETAATLA